ncbi:MAG: hypothetical protein MSH08_06140 [Ezakiella sp.]|nr:hypothetical protein [Ezakiella sp.]MDD7471905.1 hypothetical protein [Bacillota bacterium]MDY3923869.1 hypothetical protein [Ezakiella sp.]
MKFEERAKIIKEQLEAATMKRNQAIGRLEELKNSKAICIEEIKAAGSTPETIEEDIKRLGQEIESKLAECERIIAENNELK